MHKVTLLATRVTDCENDKECKRISVRGDFFHVRVADLLSTVRVLPTELGAMVAVGNSRFIKTSDKAGLNEDGWVKLLDTGTYVDTDWLENQDWEICYEPNS